MAREGQGAGIAAETPAREPVAAALRDMAASLARAHRSARGRPTGPTARARIGRVGPRLESALRRLASLGAAERSRDAEWLLDNAYLIRAALDEVAKAMPNGFYRRLPALSQQPHLGSPRVYVLGRALLSAGDGILDVDRAWELLEAYQDHTLLTTAELWALPTLLRLALLEDLAGAAAVLAGRLEVPEPALPRARPPAEPQPGKDPARIPAAIQTLRLLSTHDWKGFFEAVSRVHRTLGEDPAGVYDGMDFETRDRYRKVVEELSLWSGTDEVAVAARALGLAADASLATPVQRHVGYWLRAEGRPRLERSLRCRPPPARRLARALVGIRLPLYLGGIALLTLLAAGVVASPARSEGAVAFGLALALSLVPGSAVAVALVNWLVVRLVPPRLLPKLELRDGIPPGLRTVVAVPVLLTDEEEIRATAGRLELTYLGNADPHVVFTVLGDFPDAPAAEQSQDEARLRCAIEEIAALNERHGGEARGPFLLVHRPRTWNPSEGRWLGRERKRGKLMDLNRLILDRPCESFVAEGQGESLRGARFVLTLDADTFVPQGGVRRLVGTLGHPLNHARLGTHGRVRAGYTVLQPRIETHPGSARTPFARIQEGDRGVDLYSHAASDVYQDLFGEGIYAGKGIYDVRAFERSLAGKVPENTILSHDLFEGVHGRAGLVSDVVVYEDYPADPVGDLRRLHRWVRGDWQIARWLLPRVPAADGGTMRNRLSLLDRWKIADNLRRSLFAPSLILLAATGWAALPSAWWWTSMVVVTLALPLYLGALRRPGRRGLLLPTGPSRDLATATARLGLALVLLPARAAIDVDAAIRALWRSFVSRRRRLEWLTAYRTGRGRGAGSSWRRLAPVAAAALAFAALLALLRPIAAAAAAPLLLPWLLSPWIAARLGRVPQERARPLSEAEALRLRSITRRTWSFFERFVGPDDHWLAPDHFQEHPGGVLARRTSPTNTGLMLLSALAAWDLGYVPVRHLVARLQNAFESLARLERHRGHFLNWYDTATLEPLLPRYVSTVDSGNLAACLLALAEGCREVAGTPLVRPAVTLGLMDDVRLLEGIIAGARQRVPRHAGLHERMQSVVRELAAADTPAAARSALRNLVETELPAMEREVVEVVQAGELDRSQLADAATWLRHVRSATDARTREQAELLPWLGPRDRPELQPRLAEAWMQAGDLPDNPALLEIPVAARAAAATLRAGEGGTAQRSVTEAITALEAAADGAEELVRALDVLARAASEMAEAMDFRFLYDEERRHFRVGFDLTAGRADPSHYDLLASEVRLASYVAMAKGDVPWEHWLHLGRPFGRADGTVVLMSWAGTMFEYLMPLLLLRSPPGSLLRVGCERAIHVQRRFAERHGIPWGISESAFHHLDPHSNYQYRAFGAPDLALARDAGDRLVVAPYASLLAVGLEPDAVLENLDALEELGMLGSHGLYESVDFGSARRSGARVPRLVRSYMAHHQGMILAALGNALADGAFVRRFHADPRCAATEPLLHERVPDSAPAAHRSVLPARHRGAVAPAPLVEWQAPERLALPQAQVLSNGELSTLITASGAGGLRWRGTALTRWRADAVEDPWGQWIYVHDLDTGRLWSAGSSPCPEAADEYVATFAPHRVDLHRTVGDLSVRLTVAIAPRAPLEVRRVSVVNTGSRVRRLALTSAAEVSLARPAEDRRHPAFQKLFVESAWAPELHALVFHRRGGGACLAHGVVPPARDLQPAGWETDRLRFLGRDGSPARPEGLRGGPAGLSRTTGATLDPMFVLGYELEVPPGPEIVLSFLTAAGETRTRALAHLEEHRTRGGLDWALQQAAERSEHDLHELGLRPEDARPIQELFSALVFPFHPQRIRAPRAPSAPPARPELWRAGVSGDLPILLLRVGRARETAGALEALRAHAYLRRHGVEADLVVLDEEGTGYARPLRDWLIRYADELHGTGWVGRPGGVHYIAAQTLEREARAAVEAAASVTLDTGRGGLAEQLAAGDPVRLPPFVPMPSSPVEERETPPLEPRTDLRHDNGRGGFTANGQEYVIRVGAGRATPAPWINVVANPDFGFIASERGGGFTWAGNSGEHRLTPWRNDPVLDTPGEVLYLRDEETGEVWSATPAPRPGSGEYQVRHGQGYTVFEHRSHGLDHRLRLFVAPAAPVKVAELTLADLRGRPRRITVTYYAELVLGPDRTLAAPHVVTRMDRQAGAILAHESFSERYVGRVAFLAGSRPVHGATADRSEFLGEGGLPDPAGLARVGLADAFGAGLDPCAALQLHLDLPAGETTSVHFLLGEEGDEESARRRIRELRETADVQAAFREVEDRWSDLLGGVTVRTPEPAMDLALNRWLPYQALACRLWGRSALYQSSGAYGFRDQLQDALNLLILDPALTRRQLLEAAARQFTEGDVLHWWHPGGAEGVRTRCSDDLLWLPYVMALYLDATADEELLSVEVPFLEAPPLRPAENERYESYSHGGAGTLYEHCRRALERGITRGPHGLPLIGTGDWNDGLDRVGAGGTGESIWLGWFICATVARFAPWVERREGSDAARRLRSAADEIRQAIEVHGWDGDWYRRAYYDDGTPLGTAEADEARIDSISQSWSVLSGAGEPGRASRAVASALERLVREEDRLVLLLAPPFDRTLRDPGYIRSYPPGVRENGGQYTHAAVWLAWALAELGDGENAGALFRILNPVTRATSPEAVEVYRVEPYVVAADIYGSRPHVGRGGWTWYTGSAGWLYRLGVEAILGLRRVPGGLRVDPCIPPSWPGFEAEVRLGGGILRIRVENPEGLSRGVSRVEVDGSASPDSVLAPPSAGAVHEVLVRLGAGFTASRPPEDRDRRPPPGQAAAGSSR